MDGSVYVRGYPAGQPAAALARAVAAVCPADGVSVGRWDARETWRLDAKPEATEAEIAAARAVMAAFDPWGYGDDLGALSAAQDEGQPAASDIFTEEDVEALGAVAAEGGGEPVPGNPEDDAGPGEQEQVAGAVDHGGVLVQFDDLGKLRNDVIAAITFQEIVRARPLENDTNRWDELRDLRGLAADAGKSMDPMTEAQWDRLNELERTFHGRLNEIKRHASMLRDRAFDASPEMLAAMAADVWNGGP